MGYIQIRKCNQTCCRKGPRFPNADYSDCLMRTSQGCKLLENYKTKDGSTQLVVKKELIPTEGCIKWGKRTSEQIVQESCADWPQNMPNRTTGDCCWQWVKD